MLRPHRSGVSAVAIIIVLAVVVVILVVVSQTGMGPDGLAAHLDDYVAMLDNRGSGPADARFTGRAVVVDSEMKRLDDLHDRLSSSLRAQNHSEVETVIVLVRSGTGIQVAGGEEIDVVVAEPVHFGDAHGPSVADTCDRINGTRYQ